MFLKLIFVLVALLPVLSYTKIRNTFIIRGDNMRVVCHLFFFKS